jgi:hypothetical protein
VENPKQGPQGPDLATTLKEVAPDEVAIALVDVWEPEALRKLINELEEKQNQAKNVPKGNGAAPPSSAPEVRKTPDKPLAKQADVQHELDFNRINAVWATGTEPEKVEFLKRHWPEVKALGARIEIAADPHRGHKRG